MAADDSDVDISLPTTPTRSSSLLHPLSPTTTQRSRASRFTNIVAHQESICKNTQVPYSPGDPFTAFDNILDMNIKGNTPKAAEKALHKQPQFPLTSRSVNAKSLKCAPQNTIDLTEDPFQPTASNQSSFSENQSTSPASPVKALTKATEEACDEARRLYFKRESIVREYSRALDESSERLRELGLGDMTKSIEASMAKILQQFVRGVKEIGSCNQGKVQCQNSNLATKVQTNVLPTYAHAAKDKVTGNPMANLPRKPISSAFKEKIQVQRRDNRIFIRLPEEHTSRSHHVYAVKAALSNKLNLEHGPLRTIQQVKSGFAIVPNNDKQAEELLSKANLIRTTVGGTVEKAEEWYTYVVDHVPRSLFSLDGVVKRR